jgi:hypothetical protein
MVCGTKRIRSLNLPWMTGVTSKLATTTPPKGPASLFTITAAITPRRDAFADLPAPGGPARPRRTCPPQADLPASDGADLPASGTIRIVSQQTNRVQRKIEARGGKIRRRTRSIPRRLVQTP